MQLPVLIRSGYRAEFCCRHVFIYLFIYYFYFIFFLQNKRVYISGAYVGIVESTTQSVDKYSECIYFGQKSIKHGSNKYVLNASILKPVIGRSKKKDYSSHTFIYSKKLLPVKNRMFLNFFFMVQKNKLRRFG